MHIKTRKHSFRVGFIAGLAAGLFATGVMLFLSTAFNGVSLPEVFGSQLTALMPASMFDYLHQTIGGDAKHYLFYGIIVGQCLVFALSGAFYIKLYDTRFKRKQTSGAVNTEDTGDTGDTTEKLSWNHGLLLALILWLLTGLALLPLTGGGVFGAALSVGVINTLLSLAIVGIVFGGLYVVILNWLTGRPSSTREGIEDTATNTTNIRRRVILQRGLILIGIGIAGVGAWRFITGGASTASVPVARLVQHFKSKVVPPPVPNYGNVRPVQFLSSEITPNDKYYVVSKNLFSDPTVDASGWSLRVDGQVEHPFTLNYTELMALPRQQQYESMMCVSNEVGGEYMSNALWEGVPLKDLLTRAGVKSGAGKVVFYAVDDYSDSIHIEKALEPTTLLAVKMNNVTLPQGHGFPARMLVPGIYGMKHCKWVKHIEVVNYDFQGYWQQRGWSDPAPVRLTSRIDTPLTGSNVPLNTLSYIGGVAFSGNKGISEVDVSLDSGQTWQLATLKHPLSNLTWVLWELPWQPTKGGQYTIIVRTIDLEGNVQDPHVAPPSPDGSSGYHAIDVYVG